MKNTQGRPTTWTETDVEQLIIFYLAGWTFKEMADALGRTTGAVSGKISLLKAQGKIKDEEIPKDPTKETSELNPLEKEMAAIIEEQKSEIARLNDRIAELEAVNQEYDKQHERESDNLRARVKDLECELDDTKTALEETERQFDEYRATDANATPIIQKFECEIERLESEISRLMRAEERATRIALGVVEKFALGERVS